MGRVNYFNSGTPNFSSFKAQSGSYNPSLRSSSLYSFNSSTTPSVNTARGNSQIPIAKPVGEVRRLSETELRSKRENGECFRCDEKWSIGQRCKKKS